MEIKLITISQFVLDVKISNNYHVFFERFVMTRRKYKRMFVKLLNGFYWYFESTMICDKSKTNIKHSFIHLHTYTCV